MLNAGQSARAPFLSCPQASLGDLGFELMWLITSELKVIKLCVEQKEWQPTPVFLPGESQGRGSLVGCRLWGRTESDTT